MSQYDRIVLEIELDDADGGTGIFEFKGDLEPTGEFQRDFLIGGRGAIVNEVVRRITDFDGGSREDFSFDAGAGLKEWTFTSTLTLPSSTPLQMGDGSSDPTDETDVTAFDATGCRPETQAQILENFVSAARMDSESPGRLHWGEWSDGTQLDDGVFGRPLRVSVVELSHRKAVDDRSTVEVTIVVAATADLTAAIEALENDER